ncbi:MAG: LamG domain-containing protein, partial [Planctomycetota bacterium]
MARRLFCLMSFVLLVGAAGNVSAEELGDYYVIEDFESYNSTEELKAKWDSAGGTLGYFVLNLEYPYSGLKCLRLEYWTYDSPYYCGVSRTETPWIPADWTFEGTAETLSLQFGAGSDPNLSINGIDEIYVRLKDSSDREATVQYTDNWPVSNLDKGGHQEWNIALQEFVDDNPAIDLTNVKMLEIGVLDGLGNPPAQMGTGFIYFDDIRLYPRRCILKYGQPDVDLNDDCVVDGLDLSIMAGDWLDYDYSLAAVAVDPCDANLVAHWELDESDPCTVAVDSSGNGHHGTVFGNPVWDPNGRVAGAIQTDADVITDYIDCGGGKNEGEPNTWADITGEITVSAWVKRDFITWWEPVLGTIAGKGRQESWELFRSQQGWTGSFYVKLDGDECPEYGVSGKTEIIMKWHHIAGVYETYEPGVSSEVSIYIDGAKEGSLSCSGTPIGTCNWPVAIGANSELLDDTDRYASYAFTGHIDDVRIYDRALSHAEIVGIVKEATAGP